MAEQPLRALHTGPWAQHPVGGPHPGTSFDRNGRLRESIVTYEWGPDVMDAFPGGLYRLARAAMETLPGLRPAYSSIRCGRRAAASRSASSWKPPWHSTPCGR